MELTMQPQRRESSGHQYQWSGLPCDMSQSTQQARDLLEHLDRLVFVVQRDGRILLRSDGRINDLPDETGMGEVVGVINPCLPSNLGDPEFCHTYGVAYPYYAGAMANGINSVDMVIALGKSRILSAFGAGGLSVSRVCEAIDQIKSALADAPFAVNLLHNPGNPDWEMQCVTEFNKRGVSVVEASAYVNLSPAIVYYRVMGLSRDASGRVTANNKVIAKVSRPEVARQFMSPAPEKLLKKLMKKGLIDQAQVDMAKTVPMADDITMESDSGGHTDHGVLSCILPSTLRLRDKIQKEQGYAQRIRVGAAGGIGTPEAALAAFAMGASYIVTGSINQACDEAGTSVVAKDLLKKAEVADVVSAPSADMFELGAKVQVLKSSTMFGIRSQKLYSLYKSYDSLEQIPKTEVKALETQIFLKPLSQVWDETVDFFNSRNMPDQIQAAEKNPKRKMALVFQWYLGQSSKWAIDGTDERNFDYQIWCGPSMGACNQWLSGTAMEDNRPVALLAHNIMIGAAYLARVNCLRDMSVVVPHDIAGFSPLCETQIQKLFLQWNNSSSISRNTETLTNTTPPTGRGNTKMEMDIPNNSGKKLNLTQSKEYYKKTWDLLPGGAHYNFADPERALVVPFNKGRNSRVWDLDGNEHLDFFCKFGALFVGHHNEKYNKALLNYMEKVTSVDTCDLEYDVCSIMSNHIPCAEMIRFALSGTEAVQNALRLARAYTGKNRFIRFHGHYHGNADNVMGGRKKKDLSWPVPERFKGDMLDTQGRADNILEEQSFMLPWNDVAALETVVTQHAGEIAAVLMEPICMNGGGILPRPGYLEKAKEICERHNIVLIFDEIITGVRLGLGGAQKILGVTPHLATFGKALGGGSMPISAIAGHKDIMNLYTKGKVIHAGTFNGYPLGLAAIKATFEIIENDPDCYDRMGNIMAEICKIFTTASKRVGIPMVVQGMPTALVYHSQDKLVDRSEGYTDRVKFCDIIIREICKRYGLQFSPLSRLYPNLLINEGDIEFFNDRIFTAMENAKSIIDITFKEGELA